jgi:hypothetical protein
MSKELNPKLEVGDRVILISMEDPYSPVTAGNKGTVIGVGHDPWSTEPLYYVKWDNGRTLNLVGDEDIWMKEEKKSINENFIDEMKPLLPLLQMDKDKYVFDFLKALRDSGIVNMMQSPDFTWSGRDFLEKYLKIQELQDSYQQIDDEDEEENLLFLAQKSQQVMIQVAIRNLMDRDVELSTSNINRELRKLGPLALKYFMMKL